MAPTKVCDPAELTVMRVLDAHIDWADAILHCDKCGQHLLAEMIDLNQHTRLYRLTELDTPSTQSTLASLERGSCDLNRARKELAHLALQGRQTNQLLLISKNAPTRYIEVPASFKMPHANFRDLPCDGTILAELE